VYYEKKQRLLEAEINMLGAIKQSYLRAKAIFDPKPESSVKTIGINNRRYLGNKYKLLSFIKSIVDEHCEKIDSVADIFAGTGAVASIFADKRLITNDNLYSAYICHLAWFSPQKYSREKIERLIAYYNNASATSDNYMSDNFSDTFFSRADCRKIGFIREDVETRFRIGEINERERALLIASLLYAVDKIANTCGHYDAFFQDTKFDKSIELRAPAPSENLNDKNACYNENANQLVKRLSIDLVYIDPPYNSRQYCDAYHLLENIARWEKPKVSGVARKMNRSHLKSDYSTNKAAAAFEDLIQNINARYILLSYNNMARKGNDRSNAKIADVDIMRILSIKGEVKTFARKHKPFSTGKSDINEHKERLFLCVCKEKKHCIVQSPLNYTGGKFRLLKQILPHFPKRIDTFVDLFCGGCNVGINVNASRAIFNDKNSHLLCLYDTFRKFGEKRILEIISDIIKQYELSCSAENGYDYYGCESSSGLGVYNRKPFLRLRDDFNKKNKDYDYYIMLYVLIIYAFNNQIRFNSKGEFNLPVGKRDFNNKMKSKLRAFIDRLRDGDYTFYSVDFREFNIANLTENSLVYCDPPYLITCATYNEQNGWSDRDEIDLLTFLDGLNAKNIKFALSNVISAKGKTNLILADWLSRRSYQTIRLNYGYSNSNYQTKNKTGFSDEVLIVNY
jgi:adenine-specific DNA-methyltransferase